MKVNWQFQWGVWRKTFVDRDLNVFCICYSLFYYRSGLSSLSQTPNLEGQVITICLVPNLQPNRSTRLQLTQLIVSWIQKPFLHNKVVTPQDGWKSGGVKKYQVAGSATEWILSGTQIYEKGRILLQCRLVNLLESIQDR